MIKERIELVVSIVNLMATGILSYMAFSLSKKYSKKSQNLNLVIQNSKSQNLTIQNLKIL